MSDRTWYLFGETLHKKFYEMTNRKKGWLECQKSIADRGLAADGNKNFKEKEEYWNAYVDGYISALVQARDEINKLYEKLGMER